MCKGGNTVNILILTGKFGMGHWSAMDYTFGTFRFDNPVSPFARVQSTIARELAHYVVIYSPLQMASDLPGAIRPKA